MQYAQVNVLIKKHAVFLLILSALFFFFFYVRMNANAVAYGEYDGDEYHTIHEGIRFLFHGRVDNFRAQESVRWLVRLFYPYALIEMNTSMGGNVFIDDWQYPGHFYVKEHFIDSYNVSAVNNDPNLRVLFFSLRKLYLLFVLASFIPLLYFFYKKKYLITAAGMIILLGISGDLIHEQRLFYIEPAMIAGINLCLWAYLYLLDAKKMSRVHACVYGILFAFTVATKFSTIPFIILPALLILFIKKETKERVLLFCVFFFSFLAGYTVINFPAFLSVDSMNQFIHDLSSNFWQYAAGSSSGYTVAAGFHHFSLIIKQLEGLFGYSLYIVPMFFLFGWKHASTDEKRMLLPISAIIFLICVTISNQYVYFVRNMVPFYGAIVFIPLIAFDILRRHMAESGRTRVFLMSASFVIVLTFGGIIAHAGGMMPWKTQVFPSVKKEFLTAVMELSQKNKAMIYAVGFSDSFFTHQAYVDRLTMLADAPAVLSSGTYGYTEKKYQELPETAMVLVRRVGNNKHLTNYILPKYFDYNQQYGEYFIFYNKPMSALESIPLPAVADGSFSSSSSAKK